MNLKTLLPNASQSFLHANPQNALQDNVDAPKTKRGRMNKTEAEFAMILEAQKRKGEILRYEFEGITLRFANVKYTPDFVVTVRRLETCGVTVGARIKLIEVKGPFIKGNRERAVERFRHAKTFWPEFSFELWQRSKEGWKQLI